MTRSSYVIEKLHITPSYTNSH